MRIRETGVKGDSELYIHHPGSFAVDNLISLTFAGKFHCNDKYSVEREYQDSLLLVRQRRGILHLSYKNKEYRVNPNEIMLIDCRRPHRYYSNEDISFNFIHFTGGPSLAYWERIFTQQGPVISDYDGSGVIDALDALFKMFEEDTIDNDRAAYKIQKILYFLAASSQEASTHRSDALKRALGYINENFTNDIALVELSEIACMSPYHFSRKFKAFTGISPHKYIIYKKIFRAKNLLITTDLNVSEISDLMGFNSPSHFISTFKKNTGITPHSFRAIRF